MVDVIFYYEL